MNHPRLSDIIGIINKRFPFSLAEHWDNVGLQVGDPSQTIRRALIALDPLPAVIVETITRNCDLLLTHHPLLFSPLRSITTATGAGRSIMKMLREGRALLAMHTNYDIADGGLNDLLAERVGINAPRPLKITGREEFAKLVVFTPPEHLEAVRAALAPHTAAIGNYRDCSFAGAGTGTFLPLDGARPSVGSVGTLERVPEQRLEVLVRRSGLARAVKALLAVHPYEEPAFDCYPLLNETPPQGLGRIGRLSAAVSLGEYARFVACRLGCPAVRLTGDPGRIVKTVAVCSGSGASLLDDAARSGADLLITGDVKYHEARDAQERGLALLDAGHFPTEQIMVSAVRDLLETEFKEAGFDVELYASDQEQDPFTTLCTA